jgi:hypothetical protein
MSDLESSTADVTAQWPAYDQIAAAPALAEVPIGVAEDVGDDYGLAQVGYDEYAAVPGDGTAELGIDDTLVAEYDDNAPSVFEAVGDVAMSDGVISTEQTDGTEGSDHGVQEAAPVSEEHVEPVFNGMGERAEVAETVDLFERDELLARAMEQPMFDEADGLEFRVWESEVSQMADGGMNHVSTTLLIPDESTRVYKPSGFLVDSNRVEVEHVAKTDSLSSVDNNGKLQAHASDITTLPELATVARADGRGDMNEVNINGVTPDTIRGIFTTNYPIPGLTALAAQRFLSERGYGQLPVYVYDQKIGDLSPWNPSAQDVQDMLETIPSAWVRSFYAKGVGLAT